MCGNVCEKSACVCVCVCCVCAKGSQTLEKSNKTHILMCKHMCVCMFQDTPLTHKHKTENIFFLCSKAKIINNCKNYLLYFTLENALNIKIFKIYTNNLVN